MMSEPTLDKQLVSDGVLAIWVLYMASVLSSIISGYFTNQKGTLRQQVHAVISHKWLTMNCPPEGLKVIERLSYDENKHHHQPQTALFPHLKKD